jgi:iron complex transport system ATP-binding protein
MVKNRAEILTLDLLKIGYGSGKTRKLLLPPIDASAFNGELIAVIGRNGIGKSTLLRTITGLQSSLGGNINIYGKNIKEYSRLQIARSIGFISTETIKVSNMSVYNLVAMGRFPYTNWFGKIDITNHLMIIDSIGKAGMTGLLSRFIMELSDGERQRAMIARVLAQDAGLMVMDEPTAFLDISSKYEILHLLHDLTRKRGKTVIFSTHDFQTAINQADKIWLLLDNKLIEGAPEDLLLKGLFDHLFDSSLIRFDSKNGNFILRKEERGQIFIDGVGNKKNWTEKAVSRAGYSLSGVRMKPIIKVPSEEEDKWLFYSGDSVREFGSLYDLVGWLVNENTPAI